jgi:asparagine synthase (glutamine-hydrolysing)
MTQTISRVVDLLDSSRNVIFGMEVGEARAIIARGDPDEIRRIDGHFALVGTDGTTVRMARTLDRPMRYFIAKRASGPALVVSDRIDAIQRWLQCNGLDDQFHPSYTRMVPAHNVVEVRLVGCPDPNPTYQRFFTPVRGTLPADEGAIGERYVRAVYDEIAKWLQTVPSQEPIGVCFSGGIDSGAVFLLAYHAMLSLGMNPSRLKAFTLSVEQGGQDTDQARAFLRDMDLDLFLEVIEVPGDEIDVVDAIRVIEDYKPLDVQAGAMMLALCRGVRRRYPEWRYLLDGDGGDENLKDYPIEENPELTIRSVLNNPMLYQEGWGVHSIKHSLTYSGGQSRGCARSYAPAVTNGFVALSPYTARPVIEVAEAIPFIELTQWDEERLYRLKGEIVRRGVHAVTGLEMPCFRKRRFQHGVMGERAFSDVFPDGSSAYRRMFLALYE